MAETYLHILHFPRNGFKFQVTSYPYNYTQKVLERGFYKNEIYVNFSFLLLKLRLAICHNSYECKNEPSNIICILRNTQYLYFHF